MEMVKLTIDGKEYEAPKGKLLIEVCKDHGIDIPSFCYYPDLTPQAACRMCLVRIEKMPKLATSCTVTVADGMVVTTASNEILEMRKGMLDFILGNHPLDCPVCDKGGQCELQDMAFDHGTVYAQYAVNKNNTGEERLSPFIAFDEQRCVRCYRCIRVCEEWMDVHALTKIARGTHEYIGFYGKDLSCEQCGNCVEVCPVGALLSVDSRFKSRPWDMKETVTTCTYCGDGCQLNLGVRGEEYVRAASKDMTGINGEFLCIKGRYGSAFISSPERLKTPLVKKNGQHVAVSWDEALKYTAEKLAAVRKASGDASLAVIGSPRLTNEANLTLARLGKAFGTPHLTHFRKMELGDFWKNLSAPIGTHAEVQEATTVLVIGGDPTEESPLTGYSVRYAERKHDADLLVVHSRPIKIARRQADRFLHIRPNAESAIVQALVDEASLDQMAKTAGVPAADLRAVREAVHKAKNLAVVVGPQVTGAALKALARLADVIGKSDDKKMCFLPMAGYNNSVGAFDMGLTGNAADVREKCGQAVKAVYLVGANPVEQYGDGWKTALAKLDFLVVQELFLTETAQLADVVFPVSSYAEQDGSFTNQAGQVQRVARALEGQGQLRPDWLVVQAIAKEMGLNINAKGSAAALLKDIGTEISGYSGVSFAKIKESNGAFRTSRPLAAGTAFDPILADLRKQTGAIDTNAQHDTRVVEQGEGLFKLGTMLNQVPTMIEAQPFWDAHKGETAEWEGEFVAAAGD
ncbi:MAG: molybdopterin-dependent oxidoreductase [Blastocatellia bacterium]|nr:molybdopterin-dependent oxidoreductase [Blastocatellia bacterium]